VAGVRRQPAAAEPVAQAQICPYTKYSGVPAANKILKSKQKTLEKFLLWW